VTELIKYNEDLLEVADNKLKLLIETEHDINHPGPYFDMVNKQLDYVNTLKERIKLINEKVNADSR
jgi:hypothetical protein